MTIIIFDSQMDCTFNWGLHQFSSYFPNGQLIFDAYNLIFPFVGFPNIQFPGAFSYYKQFL